MNKILFLDIDGVLNSMDNMYSMLALWKIDSEKNKSKDIYGDLFDERCVRWLRFIVEKTDCKIIISSTWRKCGLLAMQEMWKFRNLPGEVIDITPLTVNLGLFEHYYSKSENKEADRGFEIEQWLHTHTFDNYCIVDDDNDMLGHQKFVMTESRIGLDYKSAHKIIEILNSI